MADQEAFESGIDIGKGDAKKPRGKKQGGKQANKAGGSVEDSAVASAAAIPPAFKHGGKVRKTGFAKVHKGEEVLTKAQRKKVARKRG